MGRCGPICCCTPRAGRPQRSLTAEFSPGSQGTVWRRPAPTRCRPERRRSFGRLTVTTRGRCGFASGAGPTPWRRRSCKYGRPDRPANLSDSSKRSASIPSLIRTSRPVDPARISQPVLHRSAFDPERRRVLLRDLDRHQRRRLLPQRRGRRLDIVTNEWLDANIRSKGPLGKLYPRFAFIMEGDTPSFLGLIDNGLNAYRRPDWGGWGGRYIYRQPYGETHAIWTQGGDTFSRVTSQDTVAGGTAGSTRPTRRRSGGGAKLIRTILPRGWTGPLMITVMPITIRWWR